MQRKKSTLLVFLTLLLVVGANTLVVTNPSQPPSGYTGAPGENTCATSGCHSGSAIATSDIAFNTVPTGSLTNGYTPGQLYNLTVNVNSLISPSTTQPRDGFQITALDANNDSAGTFTITNVNSTSLTTFFDRQYVGHKTANSTSAWTFRWTAPAAGTGPVTFYITANRSNNDNGTSGDFIYRQSFTFQEATVNPCTNFNAFITTPNNATSFCTGESLDLTANSASGPGNPTYSWSSGGSTATINVNTAGNYTVTVTEGSCSTSASIAVTNVTAGVADFSVTVNNNEVTINNNSTGVDGNYTWDFGNGESFADNSASFTYTYDSTGFYAIALSFTDVCGNSRTAVEQFTIDSIPTTVGIGQVNLANAVSIYPNPFGNQASININGMAGTPYEFVLIDITGKTVRRGAGVAGTPLFVNRDGLQSGIYFYNVTAQGETAKGKLLID